MLDTFFLSYSLAYVLLPLQVDIFVFVRYCPARRLECIASVNDKNNPS